MQALLLGTTTARECGACGGLWLDPSTLQRLADAEDDRAGIVSMLATRVPSVATPPDVVRYVPCPCCEKLMNRKNFAHSSGVVLDVCATHGVWLDRGELERVLGFIGGGGLTRERAHEQERLIEEQRRLLALQTARPGQYGVPDSGRSVHVDVRWGGIQSPANVSLTQLVRDAMKGFTSE
jgi:Zn-finger nucleic acid-binding protein